MKITTATTDAGILAELEAARQSLVTLASTIARAEDIAQAALAVCTAEGKAAARITYRNAIRYAEADRPTEDAAEIGRRAVTDLVLTGADDTWSGRNNDARRARFDGIRSAANEILRGW